jgi:predicted small lipoprotein YifL
LSGQARRVAARAAALGALAVLAGCGQKGPLFLPPPVVPAAAATPAADDAADVKRRQERQP